VFVVENQSGGRQYGVVLRDGLADVTRVQAGLLLAGGANGGAGGGAGGGGLEGEAWPMSQARYAGAARAASLVPGGEGAAPAAAPELVASTGWRVLCASFVDARTPPQLTLAAAAARPASEVRATSPAVPAAATADWVAVPPGRGAVVEALASPAAPTGALAVVADLGKRFPVASGEVLRVLGYPPEAVLPQRLPAALVALLPVGQVLDPAAAVLPAHS
jgi:hypothetical protein